jgi:hypothetical protein
VEAALKRLLHLALACCGLACAIANAGDIYHSRVFVWTEYVANNPSLAGMSETQARTHWHDVGSHAGWKGNNTSFNVKGYCEGNPDLLYYGYCRNYHSALIHYVDYGYAESRPIAPAHRLQGPKVGMLYSPWNAVAAALYRNITTMPDPALSMERMIREGSLGALRSALLGKNSDSGLDDRRCKLASTNTIPTAAQTSGTDPAGKASSLFCGFGNFVVQTYSDSKETDAVLQPSPIPAGRQTLPCLYKAPSQTPSEFNLDVNGNINEATDQAFASSMSCPSEFGGGGADAYMDAILDSHAQQLSDMGVDFIIIDASNGQHTHRLSYMWEFNPTLRLLDVWSARLGANPPKPTPKVAVFFHTYAPDTEATSWEKWKSIFENSSYSSLILRDTDGTCSDPPGSGCTKKVIFTALLYPPSQLASFSDNDYLKAKMWAHHEFRITSGSDWSSSNFENSAYFRGVMGFISPCVAQARDRDAASFTSYSTSMLTFTSGVNYESTHCNQPWAVGGPLGSAATATPAYQMGLASRPFEAAGRMRGLTLKRQFQSIINSDHKPRYVLVSGWNGTIAQMQSDNATSWRSAASHRQWSLGLETDSNADVRHITVNSAGNDFVSSGFLNGTASFVDDYGKEFSRTLEPTLDVGPQTTLTVVRDSSMSTLAAACVQAVKNGRCNANANSNNPCCAAQASEDEFRNIYTYSHNGSPKSPEIRALLDSERSGMSGWLEVPTTMPNNGSSDPNKPAWAFQTDFLNVRLPATGTPYIGDDIDRSGPFVIFASDKSGERDPLRRCWNGDPSWGRTYLTTNSSCPYGQSQMLGYISKTRSSETPRALSTCYQDYVSGPGPTNVGFHRFAVGIGCPSGWTQEPVLGYVK